MKYRKLGKTGIEVSVIAFGAWQAGGPPFWENTDEKVSIKAVKTALEHGINLFDTAPIYGFGRSERIIGKALKPCRKNIRIATKCGLVWEAEDMKSVNNNLKPKSIREEVEESLRRLDTDYIDIYQIHWPSQGDPIEATMEELLKLKREGKILAIGVSNFSVELLSKAMETATVDSVQPKYNMLEREAEDTLLPFCNEHDIGVLAYSPLASGLLTGKYSSSSSFDDWRGKGNFGIFREDTIGEAYKKVEKLGKTAENIGVSLKHMSLNWVLANSAVTSVLVGIKEPVHISDNVACLERPLSIKEITDAQKI